MNTFDISERQLMRIKLMSLSERKKDVSPMLVTNVEYMIGRIKVSFWVVVVEVIVFLLMNSFMPLGFTTNTIDQIGMIT